MSRSTAEVNSTSVCVCNITIYVFFKCNYWDHYDSFSNLNVQVFTVCTHALLYFIYVGYLKMSIEK